MRNSTHELIGATAATGLAIATGAEPATLAGLVITSVGGSWLPDLDEPGAKIHRITHVEHRHLLARTALLPLRLTITLLSKATRHREATHTAGAILLLPLFLALSWGFPLLYFSSLLHLPILYQAWRVVWTGLTTGYAAHVLADGCTESGVPFFAPFYMKRIHFLPKGWRFKTTRPIHPAENALAISMLFSEVGLLVLWTSIR